MIDCFIDPVEKSAQKILDGHTLQEINLMQEQ